MQTQDQSFFRTSGSRAFVRMAVVWICAVLLLEAGVMNAEVLEVNIPYREPSADRCRLDVYAPAGAEALPVVVFFHGGGLVGGERYIPGELRNQGLVVVAADYRLAPAARAPDYIEDAAAAVAWTFREIANYGGNPEQVYLSGASAGGYLAKMITLDRRWLAAHDLDANRIAGLISVGGQTITHVAVREERGIPREQVVVDDLAPLRHVRADAPPILLVTGDRELELLGRYEENAFFQRMMKVAGHVACELHEHPGIDHGGGERVSYPAQLEFIRRHAQRYQQKEPQ